MNTMMSVASRILVQRELANTFLNSNEALSGKKGQRCGWRCSKFIKCKFRPAAVKEEREQE